MTSPCIPLRIEQSPYELVPKTTLGKLASVRSRKGALLRIRFSDEKIGYADCHPWPELGDLPLQELLQQLKRGELTDLTRRSLEFARRDAEARDSGVSLWSSDAEIPKSHALVTDFTTLTSRQLEDFAKQGFTRIKMKAGVSLFEEAALLLKLAPLLRRLSIQVRLDFNSSLLLADFESFMSSLETARDIVDFIEDPIAYDGVTWESLQKRFGVRLALDRISGTEWKSCPVAGFSVLIMKPAIQDLGEMSSLAKKFEVPLVLTSYLDHPFGQICAAWTASQCVNQTQVQLETCGLLSHLVYEPRSVAGWLHSQGPSLTTPSGKGFGMDEALKKLEWKVIE